MKTLDFRSTRRSVSPLKRTLLSQKSNHIRLLVATTVYSIQSINIRGMSLRQLCKQTTKRASKALYLFPEEQKTGIAPTRIIVEKDVDLVEGQSIHVNWEGKKVQAEILAVNSKCQSYVLESILVVLLHCSSVDLLCFKIDIFSNI